MQEVNDKQKAIHNTGQELFWKYGIKRVTVEEICREAGVSKMTFYKYYKNKIELAKVIYKRMRDDSMLDYKAIMESEVPYKEKILAMLKLKEDFTKGLSKEFYNDIHKGPKEFREFVAQETHQGIEMVLSDLVQAQEDGDIRQDIKPQFILYMLNYVFEIAKDKQLLSLYDTAQGLIMELTNFFFYGILDRGNDENN